jgi:hypothetical protein
VIALDEKPFHGHTGIPQKWRQGWSVDQIEVHPVSTIGVKIALSLMIRIPYDPDGAGKIRIA